METPFFILALLAACAALLARPRGVRHGAWAAAAAGVLAGLGVWRTRSFATDPQVATSLPQPRSEGGFVSSAACQSCHPAQYHSWHRSFHRTMTQPATPENVLGDFGDVHLQSRGVASHLTRAGDRYFTTMPHPGWFVFAPADRPPMPAPIEVPVVMVTGSHHLQTYWVRSPDPQDPVLRQMPWVWLVAERRWVPNQDSFLTPQQKEPAQLMPWITSCNMCHSVATQPHLWEEGAAARTAELGIACEACHGPAHTHVETFTSPWRRYLRHLRGDAATEADPTIVNPARLAKQRSVEVCGQCHSFHKELDMERWSKTGVAYRAGGDLGESVAVFRYTENPTHPRLLEHLKAEPAALAGRFWKDGTIRVAGREYNGLLETKCHTAGDMTCLSCHSMHGYVDRDSQLARDRDGDQACLQCHADYRDRIAAHSHHPAASSGARCMNCHMPHTTLGLLVAMRSHRIDSPSAAVSAATGRPNACNLCHLDRTLAWTDAKLGEWYGHAPATLTDDQRNYAASLLWLTAGDGAQRAVVAWAMGWEPAQQASGRGWEGAFLTELLRDPYAVNRQIAFRSLRTLPGFSDFAFDYIAPADQLGAKARAGVQAWLAASKHLDRHGPHLLVDAQGRVDVEAHYQLLRKRDLTPVTIIE